MRIYWIKLFRKNYRDEIHQISVKYLLTVQLFVEKLVTNILQSNVLLSK
jgi:hypothetical protein